MRRPLVLVIPRDLRRQFNQFRTIPQEIHGCRLPPLPPAASLGDLRLTGRALRFFQQGEYVKRPEALAELTIADLLAQEGIGSLTVIDIVEALYRCAETRQDETTLEEDVLGWLVPKGQPLHRRIVAQRFGLNGHRPHSLTAVGSSNGCTHQRIRQICVPRCEPPASLLNKFQAAVNAARAFLPAAAADIESCLVRLGLFEPRTKLETLVRIARLLDRDAGFILEGKGPGCRALPAPTETTTRLRAFLTRQTQASLVMQTTQLLARWRAGGESPLEIAVVERTVDVMRRAHWLDRASGWFWVDRPNSALCRRIDKALAAAGRLTIAELAAAVWRGPKTKHWPRPPLGVFRELCRQLPEYRVAGQSVCAADLTRARHALSGGEKKLAEFLRGRGGACHLNELRAFAARAGISEFSLWQYLIGSSTLKCCGPSLYGTLGL